MANASRWSLSARQGFMVITLFAAGLFVLCCGTGMASVPIAVMGVAVGLLGPIVIALSSVRANRADVFGTAHVSQSSPPPLTGIHGRADLRLLVNAQGVRNAVVRIRDPEVPVSKWPDVGATLPVLIPNGNPRRLQVLWDDPARGAHVAQVVHTLGRQSRGEAEHVGPQRLSVEPDDVVEVNPVAPLRRAPARSRRCRGAA